MVERKPRCKTGCTTCRIRKIKCDETKPACIKCKSTGRKCDGYPPPQPKNPEKSRAESQSQSQHHPTKQISGPPLPLGLPGELRAIEFFRFRTAPALTSLFASDFWVSTVLTLSAFDPMIRHSVVALSNLHEGFEMSFSNVSRLESVSSCRRLALFHYVLATKEIQQRLPDIQTRSPAMLLVASINLISLELLHDNYLAAISHFDGALHIIARFYPTQQQESTQSPSDALAEVILKPFFEILVQTMYLQIIGYDISIIPKVTRHDLAPTFHSIGQAKSALNLRHISAYSFFWEVKNRSTYPDQTTDLYQKESSSLTSWRRSFSDLLFTLSPAPSPRDLIAIEMLKIRYHCLQSMMDQTHQSHLNLPDTSAATFTLVLDTIDALLNPTTACALPRYSFDMGVIGPLCYTALKAPLISIRRRATTLLRHPGIPFREGLWGSRVTAALTGKILELQVAVIEGMHEGEGEMRRERERALDTGTRITWFSLDDLVDDEKSMRVSVGRKDAGGGALMGALREQIITWDTW